MISEEEAEYQVPIQKRTIEAIQAPVEPQSPVKCQKKSRRSRSQTPPEFWNSLSRVPLCRRALRELNRRLVQPTIPKPPIPLVLNSNLSQQQLKRFARYGGPDLQDIRGVGYISILYRVTLISFVVPESRDKTSL
jgi:hypothetical protein